MKSKMRLTAWFGVASAAVIGTLIAVPRPQAAPAQTPEQLKAESVSLSSASSGFDSRRDGVPASKVETLEYDSRTVGNKRSATIYLPPGYPTSGKYPVLYLMHGIGGNEKNWTMAGKADAILDNLLAAKKIVPMIVVMPNGRASKEPAPKNPFEGNPFADYAKFEEDLLKDLIPAVESRYSVRADRESRAIAGLSMGGGQALNFGLGNLDRFAWVGGFSSAPNTKPIAQLVPNPDETNRKLRLLWVSCGEKDFILNISRQVHEGLKERKVIHMWYFEPGAHEFSVWKNDLYQFAQLIFKPSKVSGGHR